MTVSAENVKAPTTTHLSFRIETELAEQLEQLAKANERSISGQVRHMLREALRVSDGKVAA